MSKTDTTCPKCQSVMEAGAIVEQGYLAVDRQPAWVPEHAKAKLPGNFFPRFPLFALRCVKCGFVEVWAPQEQRFRN